MAKLSGFRYSCRYYRNLGSAALAYALENLRLEGVLALAASIATIIVDAQKDGVDWGAQIAGLVLYMIVAFGGFFVIGFVAAPVKRDKKLQRRLARYRADEAERNDTRALVRKLYKALYDFRQPDPIMYPGGGTGYIAKLESIISDLYNAIWRAYSPGEGERFRQIVDAAKREIIESEPLANDYWNDVYPQVAARIYHDMAHMIDDNDPQK